jgi:hypothetical protein
MNQKLLDEAGYRALCARGDYAGVEDVLILHTGGAPSLFTSIAEGS